jgi:hypothetical protein
MTTWTAPRTWISETLTSTLLNIHLRDNLNHLKENLPPGLAGSADIAGVGGAGTSEEWGTATTGLTWTPSNPTTVDSNTTIPNHLYILNQADSTERFGLKDWVPGAGAFDARLGGVMVASDASVAAVTGVMGLCIANSANTDRLMLQVTNTFSTAGAIVAAYTYTGGSYTQRGSNVTVGFNIPLYFRIVRDGSNNCSFYWSPNGILWQFIATQSFTLTVAKIGVRPSGNSTATFKTAVDWLRTSV